MKRHSLISKTCWMAVGLGAGLLALTSCRDRMAEYYARPDWIKGNCYEMLEQDGHYSTFLKAIELAGFRDMVDGKSIVTVLAPDDEAFDRYLAAKGLNDISELDSVELEKLVGFHLVYYAYNADKFNNFRPEEGDDVTDEEKRVNAGMYYKHRTKSRDANTVEYDNTRMINVTIYHHERFVPVFSQNYFNTKRINAADNYGYFFPETPWNATGIGYNVAGASVVAGNQITSNGYVHTIDQVLDPLKTIYGALQCDSDFSQFLALYKKYEYFEKDEELTREYGNGTTLYKHLFSYRTTPLPNIASEWTGSSYSDLTTLSSVGYTIFAPTNVAMQTFFDNYWGKGGYASLSQVSVESVRKLLFNCIYKGKLKDGRNGNSLTDYDGNLAFPEEIRRGDILNTDGTPISINLDAIPAQYRILCENGLLYGCTEMPVPATFSSVLGPAYQYKDLSLFLVMLNSLSNLESTLCNEDLKLITLMPDNAQMNAAGISYNSVKSKLERGGSDLNNEVLTSTAYAHLVDLSMCTGGVTELDSLMKGQEVLRTLSTDYTFYWYLLDGKITNSFHFNKRIYPQPLGDEDIFASFSEMKSYTPDGNWLNGKSYRYQGSLMVGMPKETNYRYFLQMAGNNLSDESLPYHGFASLLTLADMYTDSKANFRMDGDVDIMLIPTNEAVTAKVKAGGIPGIVFDQASYVEGTSVFDYCTLDPAEGALDSLQAYLKTYFIPMETAGVSNFPYLGWNEDTSKGLPTRNAVESVDPVTGRTKYAYRRVVITDKGHTLGVRRLGDAVEYEVVDTYHAFPFIFDDGCVQFINGMF